MIKTREGGNRFPHSNVRPNCISLELLKERRKPGEPEKEIGWNHKLWTVVSAAAVWSNFVRGLSSCGDSEIYCRGNGLYHKSCGFAKVRAVKMANGASPLPSVA